MYKIILLGALSYKHAQNVSYNYIQTRYRNCNTKFILVSWSDLFQLQDMKLCEMLSYFNVVKQDNVKLIVCWIWQSTDQSYL